MPLDPNSSEIAVNVSQLSPFSPAGAWGSRTSFNTSSYGTQPIHAYLVDSTVPGHGIRKFAGSVSISTDLEEQNYYLNGDIPLEPWMAPAQNGDRGMAVYDKGTGIMREYFMVEQAPGQSDPNVWSGTGGYSIAKRGLTDLKNDNWALQQRRGLSNIAGMHNSFGFIGIQEALAKKINHALCVTASTLRMRKDDGINPIDGTPLISYPARGADGKLENYLPGGISYATHPWNGGRITPTHGQWGRLKESVDPLYNPKTGKPYPEFCQVVIQAVKTYGLIFTDTNLWCHAFNCEQGVTFKHFYGVNPWAPKGIIHKNYVGKYGEDGFTLVDFPWEEMEWAPVDWGRPIPDWNLRPDQTDPWGAR